MSFQHPPLNFAASSVPVDASSTGVHPAHTIDYHENNHHAAASLPMALPMTPSASRQGQAKPGRISKAGRSPTRQQQQQHPPTNGVGSAASLVPGPATATSAGGRHGGGSPHRATTEANHASSVLDHNNAGVTNSTYRRHSLPVVVPGPGEPQTAIYPAITHFSDAISALPRDFQRHASLLKEVDSKAWRLEEVLSRQLTQAAELTPFKHLMKGFLKDPENGAKLRDSAPHDSSKTTHSRQSIFSNLRSILGDLMVTADEKNHVLFNANLDLQRHFFRLDNTYAHAKNEVSPEARIGNSRHWAYQRKPEKTTQRLERPRRENAGHNRDRDKEKERELHRERELEKEREKEKEVEEKKKKKQRKHTADEHEDNNGGRKANSSTAPGKRRRVDKTTTSSSAQSVAEPASRQSVNTGRSSTQSGSRATRNGNTSKRGAGNTSHSSAGAASTATTDHDREKPQALRHSTPVNANHNHNHNHNHSHSHSHNHKQHVHHYHHHHNNNHNHNNGNRTLRREVIEEEDETMEAADDEDDVIEDESRHDDRASETEPRYCYCNQVSFGEMVACDYRGCKREWFHLSCVGMSKPPGKSTKWYCDECKETLKRGKGHSR